MWQIMYDDDIPVNIELDKLWKQLDEAGFSADRLIDIAITNEGRWVRVEHGMVIRKLALDNQ